MLGPRILADNNKWKKKAKLNVAGWKLFQNLVKKNFLDLVCCHRQPVRKRVRKKINRNFHCRFDCLARFKLPWFAWNYCLGNSLINISFSSMHFLSVIYLWQNAPPPADKYVRVGWKFYFPVSECWEQE